MREQVPQRSRPEDPRAALSLASTLHGYVPALGALALATAVHFLCYATVGIGLAGIFFIYLMAVLIAAWCGYGPGLLVLFIGLLVLPYAYRPNFSIRKLDAAVPIVMVMVCLITSRLSASRRSSEAFLQRANQDLDERVRKQTAALQHQLAELETLYGKLSVGLGFYDTKL